MTSSTDSRTPDADLLAPDADRVAAEPDHRHLGGVAGPVGRLLEDQGHALAGQDRRRDRVARPGRARRPARLGSGRRSRENGASRGLRPAAMACPGWRRASSISASVTSNDGASRSAVGVTALTTRPASRAAGRDRAGSFPPSSSAATSRPRPPHRGHARGAAPGQPSGSAPAARARAGTSSASITASTARAAAVARGWPPKVVAWSPGTEGRRHVVAGPAGPDGHAVAEGLGHR